MLFIWVVREDRVKKGQIFPASLGLSQGLSLFRAHSPKIRRVRSGAQGSQGFKVRVPSDLTFCTVHLPCCCSVAKSCPTPHDSMDCSTPGFPVLHCLPEFAQAHVHWVSDTIQPSHSLSSPSPLALNLSQH